MMRVIALISLLLLSCDQSSNRITVKFTDVEEMEFGTIVKYDSLVIGEIKDLKIDDSKNFLARIELYENYVIPVGSIFLLTEENFWGNRHIEIDISNVKIGIKGDYFLGGLKKQDLNALEDTSGIPDHVRNLNSLLRDVLDQ